MAFLDPERQCLVVRMIYDGPAYAGKTTNLRTLAESLGSQIHSGEEAEGRTLYFDWVDYLGGRFEGMPIRCQIVAVPGQKVLEGRRRLLLETADVVVFVADSRQERLAENRRSFEVLRNATASSKPPIGIVVQANKRDIDSPLSLNTLREALSGDLPLAMTDAIAETGTGVRETFVLAVRLALDRVRELWNKNALPRLAPQIDDPQQLLSALQEAEETGKSTLSPEAHPGEECRFLLNTELQPRREPSPPASRIQGPPLPDTSIPPGLVWPPVEGRAVLHEAARVRARLERVRDGDWIGLSDEWMLRSPLEGLFFELEEAREALVKWARWHALADKFLSKPRCLVVNPEPNGSWRLWQIVRRAATLRDIAANLFRQPDDAHLGEGLFQLVDLRVRAERNLVDSGWLERLDLDSVGVSALGDSVFIGFVPYPGGSSATVKEGDSDETRLLRDELAPLIRKELAVAPRRFPEVLASLQEAAESHQDLTRATMIQQILLGS